jgi:hypothetical protein
MGQNHNFYCNRHWKNKEEILTFLGRFFFIAKISNNEILKKYFPFKKWTIKFFWRADWCTCNRIVQYIDIVACIKQILSNFENISSSFIFTLFTSGKALFKEKGDEITFFLKHTSFAENSATATKRVIQNNNKTMSIVSLI